MKWKKIGKIYSIDEAKQAWCVSHTSAPQVEIIDGDRIRIFFSCRDIQNASAITCIEYDIKKHRVVRDIEKPLLLKGEPGLFDDCGCFMGSIISVHEKKCIYYQGWNLTYVAPQGNFIGMAVYDPEKDCFHKYSRVPVVDRSELAPFSLSMPIVIKDNSKYRMYFGSNITWMGHRPLNIRIVTAESFDGYHWDVIPGYCIEPQNSEEYSFAVSTVIKEKNLFKMFYSYRGDSYRIGYAESTDGYVWSRKDTEIDIDVSNSGWDSEMIEYPAVFDYENQRYMLYCGNGYGKSGLGIAILEV